MKNVLSNPNFRRWFGRSKVVDKSGNPLKVYHGTFGMTHFTRFAPNSQGVIYFSEDPGYTGNYSGGGEYTSGRTFACYLRIKRPLDLTKFGLEKNTLEEWIEKINKRSWGLEIKSDRLWYLKGDNTKYFAYMLLHFYDIVEAIKKNYDGVYLVENFKVNDPPYKAWAVFESTQVKSAISNRGTYDPDNPDINEKLSHRVIEEVRRLT